MAGSSLLSFNGPFPAATGAAAPPRAPAAPPPTSQTKRFSISGSGQPLPTAPGKDPAEQRAPPAVAATTPTIVGSQRSSSFNGIAGTPPTRGMSWPSLPSGGASARSVVRSAEGRPGATTVFDDRPHTSGPHVRRGSEESGGPELLRTLPGRIQDSLKMFEEFQAQRATLLSQDSGRLATVQPQETPAINSHRSASVGRTPRDAGRGQPARDKDPKRAAEKEAQQRKLHLAEQMMKKLHKKNQRLARENEGLREELQRLRGETGPQEGRAEAEGPTDGDMQRLRSLLADRERELAAAARRSDLLDEQLRKQRAGQQPGTSRGELSAARSQLTAAQGQYKELLDCRLDAVAGAGSTSKVNKEVKQFFVALRRKVHEDMLEREVARQVWNQHMLELEEQLCDKHAREKAAER